MRARAPWIKTLAAALGLAAFAHCAGAATLTVDAARAMARDAYVRGDIATANALAKGLAKARPEEAEIFVMLAATEARLGRGAEALEAGRRAYGLADDRALKHQAAYVTSRAAVADQRYTSAQWWLRRAYHLSDSDEERAQVARAFRQVRNENPLGLQLNFAVAPTSNVNGGSSQNIFTIDDEVQTFNGGVGTLDPRSQAISGTRMSAAMNLTYRLSRGEAHRTDLRFYGLRTWNRLDEEVDGVDASDYDYGLAELEVTHAFRGGPVFLPDQVAVAIGQVWSGGETYERVGRLSLSRRFNFGDKTSLKVTGEIERRLSDQGRQDRNGTKLRFDLSHQVGPGVAQISIAQSDVTSDFSNWNQVNQTARLSYTQTKGIAGVRLAGSLAWGEKVFEDFILTERQDTTRSGSVSVHLDRFALMGFAPVVTYAAEQTDSNFSLYERRTYGWTLGLRSSF